VNDSLHARWRGLCDRLLPSSSALALAAWPQLQAAYLESHRHYHTLQHIQDCLEWLDRLRHLAHKPDEIEFAIWFHDAIYKVDGKPGSEAQSAQRATGLLDQCEAPDSMRQREQQKIMATCHAGTAPFSDAGLMVDIDLSILGADPVRFDRYNTNIRKEFAWVPEAEYRKVRKDILEGFLQRSAIYVTAELQQRWEGTARLNLARAIDSLMGD